MLLLPGRLSTKTLVAQISLNFAHIGRYRGKGEPGRLHTADLRYRHTAVIPRLQEASV